MARPHPEPSLYDNERPWDGLTIVLALAAAVALVVAVVLVLFPSLAV